MTKAKFQFDLLNLLFLTVIVALIAILVVNSSKHSSQVKALEQRIQEFERKESIREKLYSFEVMLSELKAEYGIGHPQVIRTKEQVERLKSQLSK